MKIIRLKYSNNFEHLQIFHFLSCLETNLKEIRLLALRASILIHTDLSLDKLGTDQHR